MPEDLALIFAYHFPPENVIGALRPFRFCKYLSRLGYKCHVISAADTTQMPGTDAQFVPDPFETKPGRRLGWQAERAIRKFVLPGVVGSQWAIHAYKAAAQYTREYPRQRVTVFSTFPPVGTHLAAYWFARRHHLPWIADFRDPLGGYSNDIHTSSLTKNVYRKLERMIVSSADFVIANTDTAQDELRRAYPERADRIKLIWNGFDPEDRLPPLPVMYSGRKVVSHVGELYAGRSATPLLQSLRRLIESGKLAPDDFQVCLAGEVAEGSIPDPGFMAAASKAGWLKLIPDRVPQQDAHRIVQTSDALLLIQPHTALQVPGKLFDYIQIGRPILAFVPPNSPVERILRNSGVPYHCIYPSFSQHELDESVLQFFQMDSVECRPSPWFEAEFNAQTHAEKLADLIQQANSVRAESSVVSRIPQRESVEPEP
ncbi:MAG: glycosyltransferase [Acidobacteriaceae bacterium]|nr:glycosyltransferase [Acidobacteriaceae bacterium]